MTRPSPLWRAIVWVERFLPAPRDPVADARSGRRDRWTLLIVLLPIFLASFGNLAVHRAEWAGAWPVWRPVVLDALLVAAGACLVAIAAAVVMGWRQARRGANA